MICPKPPDDEKIDLDLERNLTPIEVRRKRWLSCCFYIDPAFATFIVKYIILIGMLVFFSVELHISTECEDKNLYQSLLLLCLGLAIPAPTIK